MIRTRPSLAANDSGVIAPATAVVMAALIGMVGLVTDTSVWYAQRRQLQAVTDAAALAAAPYAATPGSARTAANGVLTANGVNPATTIVSFATGQYCPSNSVSQRFQSGACPGAATATSNAVRIQTGLGSPLFFSRLFTSSATTERRIGATATAARINQAGIQAGSGLLDINNGAANAVLSALTGSQVALTAVQYQGLLSTNVDTLTFLDKLATKLNVTSGTYSGLLQSNVLVSDVIAAQIAALNQQSQVADVAAAIGALTTVQGKIVGSPSIALGKLFDLGLWGNKGVGSAGQSSALQAGVNIMQLTSLSLQLANGKNVLTIPSSSIGIDGVASVKISATAIEPPVGFAFGPEGTSVHTGQVRVKLVLQVLNLVPQLGTGLNVPIYIEVASGDARIDSICPGTPAQPQSVGVTAHSGLADIYLGATSDDAMKNFTKPVTVTPVKVLNIGLPGILTLADTTASAHVTVGSTTGAGTGLTFVQPSGTVVQPKPPTRTGVIGRSATASQAASLAVVARATSTSLGSNLVEGLADSLSVNACVANLLGLCLLPTTLKGADVGPLFTILKPVLKSLDSVVDGLLRTLGVQLGYVDVAVTGVRCGYPVLVS